MKIPQSYIQKCKVAAHILQGLLVFIAGCVTIAVYTKDGSNGPTSWLFALCWLSIPALIYLTMTPMWPRAARFVNVWAFVAVDALYTILWFSAFLAVAVWSSNGIRDGEADAKKDADESADKDQDPPTGCDAFAYGEPAKCRLSRATVGIGVIIFIFFGLTTAISAYALRRYRKDGTLIFTGKAPTTPQDGADHSEFVSDAQKDAWADDTESQHNSYPHDHDDDAFDDENNDERYPPGYGFPPRKPSSYYGDSDIDPDEPAAYDPGQPAVTLAGPSYEKQNSPFADAHEVHPGTPVGWGRSAPPSAYPHEDSSLEVDTAYRGPAKKERSPNAPSPGSGISPAAYVEQYARESFVREEEDWRRHGYARGGGAF